MKIIVLIAISLLWGCSENIEHVKIRYNNGNLFCVGKYWISHSFYSFKRHKIGEWKFYNIDNSLHSQQNFDDDGKLIQLKTYSEDNKLLKSFIKKEGISFTTNYYTTGEIKEEIIETIEVAGNEEDNWQYKNSEYKKYYKNGIQKENCTYEDGVIQGIYKIWDENGNLMAEIKYMDGMVVPNDEDKGTILKLW
ncbi:MAG: hypothetical protein IPM32_09270 [Ignavibacteriae bacterium]|nr:hypothetical protein [Ignavibacteriota bacterium]